MRIDRLKIDRNFVTGISSSAHNQALVTALLTLGKALGLEILVEGVETQDEAETLIAMGCDKAQGFLFSKALSSTDAVQWLAGRRSSMPQPVVAGTSKRIA
jgi:diguanylate cyclase